MAIVTMYHMNNVMEAGIHPDASPLQGTMHTSLQLGAIYTYWHVFEMRKD